jgi:hypothetical protein
MNVSDGANGGASSVGGPGGSSEAPPFSATASNQVRGVLFKDVSSLNYMQDTSGDTVVEHLKIKPKDSSGDTWLDDSMNSFDNNSTINNISILSNRKDLTSIHTLSIINDSFNTSVLNQTDGKLQDRTFFDMQDNDTSIIKAEKRPGISGQQRKKDKRRKREEEKRAQDPMTEIIDDEYYEKLSYADCAAGKYVMLEVRCDQPLMKLGQDDFDEVDRKILKLYNKYLKEKNPFFEYKVLGGMSQGALWVACANQATADFFKEQCEELDPPADFKYKYIVYDADEKPFRYMKAKIPPKFWENEYEELEDLIRISNVCLTKKFKMENGEQRDFHFKIVGGMTDKKVDIVCDEETNKPKYFIIELEVDEKLFDDLIKLNGKIKLGFSTILLQGGGVVKASKDKIRAEINLRNDLNVSC